jgi:hypothetical protein
VPPVTNGVDNPPEARVNIWADPDFRNPVVTVSALRAPIAGKPDVVG